jgi:ribulose-5-phosphate 4-epimerase/fuculose-1-phosphate aldolase
MYNQVCCRFYKSHGIYREFGGVVLTEKESMKICDALGKNNKVLILQKHGETVDEASFWYICFEKLCETRLQIEAATRTGFEPFIIDDQAATYTQESIGSHYRGWQNFQGYMMRF